MATDESTEKNSSPEELKIEDYPSERAVPDEALEEQFSDPYRDDQKHDGEVVRQLREMGVAVIRASYRGGHDEAYYDLVDLFDEEGRSVQGKEEIAAFLGDLGWSARPEVIAVDRAHGGSFSGAGVGREYGGRVEMRLDTLETREISTYAYQRNQENHSTAEWEDGHSAVY